MSRLDGYRALLLDAAYRPVCALGWQRALVLSLADRVEVLETYAVEARTATTSFPLPAVIRVRQVLACVTFQVPLTRKNVLLRDGHCCQYCGGRPAMRDLTVDHVVPRSRGGDDSWTNLVTACSGCNHKKGSRTPEEANMPLARVPVRPQFVPAGRRAIAGEPPLEWRDYLSAA